MAILVTVNGYDNIENQIYRTLLKQIHLYTVNSGKRTFL